MRESQPEAGGEVGAAGEAAPKPGPGQNRTGEGVGSILGARGRGAPFSSEDDQLPNVPCSAGSPSGPSKGDAPITS